MNVWLVDGWDNFIYRSCLWAFIYLGNHNSQNDTRTRSFMSAQANVFALRQNTACREITIRLTQRLQQKL